MGLNYDIRRPNHAIGEFTATLTFFGSVGAPTFARVQPLLAEVAKQLDLPATMNIQVLNFSFGNNSAPPPPTGTGYQRFAGNGEVACSLWCDASSITLTVRDYKRWEIELANIINAFSQIAPAYMVEVPAIHSFTVQYLNEFRAKDEVTRIASELFKRNNGWVYPRAFENSEPWHCHVGEFLKAEPPSRLLVNVNCDASLASIPPEQIVKHYVKVLILVAKHYDLPGIGPLIAKIEDLEQILRKNFDSIHDVEKKLLREIISDDYLEIMGDGAK